MTGAVKIIRLGDVATYINGYAFKPSDWSEVGKPIIRIQDLTGTNNNPHCFNGEIPSKYVVKNGDVLISWSASLGVYIWNRGEAYLNQHIFKVVFDKIGVDKKFFAHQVPLLLSSAMSSAHGCTMKHLTKPLFDGLLFKLPPLAEQKRIVAKIDAAFEKIDALKANAEKNLANAKELFQSALDEAMRPKKGWIEKRLGEVCEGKLSYGTSSPSKGYDARVRYIRITDIDDNGRLLNDLVSPKEYESKHVLEDGDLVFARTGATVGKSYMYSPSDGACVYAGYLIRARVDQSIIRPKYLFYFTKTSRYKLFIQQSQAAAAQPNVNAEKYSNMLVPIPPVHEQDEIVSCIGRAQGLSIQLQQNYAQQIADCAEMRQAILREAFEGRL